MKGKEWLTMDLNLSSVDEIRVKLKDHRRKVEYSEAATTSCPTEHVVVTSRIRECTTQ